MCQQTFLKTCILLLLIDDVVNLSSIPHRHSGLYVDNGEGQTMIHKLISKKEKRTLKDEIQKLFRFPDKPWKPNGKAPLMTQSAVQFLRNIYNNSLGSEGQVQQNISGEMTEFDLSQLELLNIDKSDTIIAFTPQKSHQEGGGKPDNVTRMWFNVSNVPEDDQMTSAELRLYRGSDAKNENNRGAFTITVFRVTRANDEQRGMQFVDSINSTAGQQGWITLNITESLRHWMTNPSDNKGLHLSVNPIDRSDHETRPEDIGIVGFKGDIERQPFMVGFFKSTELKQGRVNQQTLLSFDLESTRTRRRDVADLLKNHYARRDVKNEPCKLRNLYVNFKDFQWHEQIIQPKGYDAYYCDGECSFPIYNQLDTTNHAIVQTHVHHMHPNVIPKPCCTPTKLSPTSIIYFSTDHQIIFQNFENMVVSECGCR